MRHFNILYLIFKSGLLFLLFSSFAFAEDNVYERYYARFDIKSINKVIVDTHFTIIPDDEEYRFGQFMLNKVSGESSQNTDGDLESAAKCNAFSRLLAEKGLRSVKTKSVVMNHRSYEETIVSYEGVIRYPSPVIYKGYEADNGTCMVEMEVWFSPLSSPRRWPFLYSKFLIKKAYKGFISIFNPDYL